MKAAADRSVYRAGLGATWFTDRPVSPSALGLYSTPAPAFGQDARDDVLHTDVLDTRHRRYRGQVAGFLWAVLYRGIPALLLVGYSTGGRAFLYRFRRRSGIWPFWVERSGR